MSIQYIPTKANTSFFRNTIEMKKLKPQWIQQADTDIRRGYGNKVLKSLRLLKKNGVPADQIFEVAKLAKRVGMFQFATNILYRLVTSTKSPASHSEIAEYATNLAAIGNYQEAQEIFTNLPNEVLGDYCIQYSEVLFRNWDYGNARQLLERFQPIQFETYKDLVYGLNLASSRIGTQDLVTAEDLLERIISRAIHEKHIMILGNCLELKGQIYFQKKQWDLALKHFVESEKLLRRTNNITYIFSLRWVAITQLAINPKSQKALDDLNSVRIQSRKFLYWESLRECDLYEAIYTNNEQIYNRVYYATPNIHYRKKVLRLNENKLTLDPHIQFGPPAKTSQYLLDLNTVEFQIHNLKLNGLAKKLLLSVASDLYRPANIYQLNRDIFSEEHFNPFSSKDKTYKVIRKVRDLLKRHPSGCQLESRRGYGYRLRTREPIILLYPEKLEQQKIVPFQNELIEIKKYFGKSDFSRKQFCSSTSRSERSGSRLLKELIDNKVLVTIGRGTQIKYKLIG